VTETSIVKQIQLDHSTDDVRLFRNNIGECWQGKAYRRADGSVIIVQPYRVTYGLCVGSGDLVGFKSVTVTPEMVGQRIAVFASIEVKDTRGRKSYQQEAWLEMCAAFGAIAGVARSSEQAAAILAGEEYDR
jgi:hypothetical protein